MGMLDKFSSALGLGGGEASVQDYLDGEDLENLADDEEEVEAYVKPLALESARVLSEVQQELRNGNLVLLNISPMKKDEKALAELVGRLKEDAMRMKGDIARIDDEKILLTPARIRIVKRRR